MRILPLCAGVVAAAVAGAVVAVALTPRAPIPDPAAAARPALRRAKPARAAALPAAPTAATPAMVKKGGPVAMAPVSPLYVTSPYGKRGWRFHSGVDLRARTGQPLSAVGSGTVARTGRNKVGGLTVVVDLDDGWRAGYAHLSQIDVADGDRVAPGTRIGLAGSTGRSTGPHLHFELREPRSGALVDPWPHLVGKAPMGKPPMRSTLQQMIRAARRFI